VLETPDQIIVARTNEPVNRGCGYRLDAFGILVRDARARWPAKVIRRDGADVEIPILFAWA
jgi:hypothetical protein